MEIFKLFGSILIDNNGANESLDKTDKKGQGIAKTFGKGIKSAAKWGVAVAGAATVVGTAVFGVAKKTADATDRIDKMSQKLGLSRTGFQEWEFVLSQAGVEIDSMQSGMKTLTQKMNDAVTGAGTGAKAFKELGVEITEGMSQEEAFNKTITALQGMEDGIKKADLAQELFGRSGQELLPLLNGEAGSVEELKAKANELGLVLGDDAVDAGVKFTDTLDQLKRSFGSIGLKLGSSVMPVVQGFMDWIMSNMPTIQATISAVFSAIGTGINILKLAIDILRDRLVIFSGENSTQLNTIQTTVMTVINNIKDFISVFVDFAMKLWEKYGSSIMAISKKYMDLVMENIQGALDIISNIFKLFSALLKGDWEGAWDAIKNIVSGALDLIKGVLDNGMELLKTLIGLALNAIKEVFKNIFNGLAGIARAALGNLKSVVKAKFDDIKEKIMSPIRTAVEFVKKQVEKIKGFFDKLKIKFPHIDLPHFSLEGKFSLKPPSVPSVGVEWYAKGTENAKRGLAVVGENGPELVSFKGGEKVYTADETKKMTGNNQTVNIYSPTALSPSEIARQLKRVSRELAMEL